MESSIIQKIYNKTIRPKLPRRLGVFNGIPARGVPVLDRTSVHHDYETPNIESLYATIEPGDDVVIVGGGLGVTAVHAARAGARKVTVFEGGSEQVETVRETARINHCQDTITVKHAVVGDSCNVWGSHQGATTITGEALPDCDVLEIDAEGAEDDILREVDSSPRNIIVEVHPGFGVSVSTVEELLEDLGYDVIERADSAEILTAK